MYRAFKRHLLLASTVVLALGLPAAANLSSDPHVAQDASNVTAKPAVPAFSHRIALVIGNANYPDANAPIANAIGDSLDLAESLRNRNFDVEVIEDAMTQTMDVAIETFVAKAGPGVTAVVAFNGYGLQSGHENYMIPTDAQIWKERDVRRAGFSLSTLLARLSEKRCEHMVAILDASRRNPFERRFRSGSEGLAAVEPPRGTIVFSTMMPGRVSDGTEAQSRPLRSLVKLMDRAQLDAEPLFARTRREVSIVSKGRQVPVVASTLVDTFSF